MAKPQTATTATAAPAAPTAPAVAGTAPKLPFGTLAGAKGLLAAPLANGQGTVYTPATLPANAGKLPASHGSMAKCPGVVWQMQGKPIAAVQAQLASLGLRHNPTVAGNLAHYVVAWGFTCTVHGAWGPAATYTLAAPASQGGK